MRGACILTLLLCATAATSCSDGLSPARDLSGLWVGTAPNGLIYTDNADNPNCAYEADVRLTLIQDGSALTGSFTLTVRSSEQLLGSSLPCVAVGASGNQALFGTVSSSTVTFGLADLTTDFEGQFTSDILTGNITSSAASGINGTLRAMRQ